MFVSTNDGWCNCWWCKETNIKLFRIEKNGERPNASTRKAADKICKKCKNICKGWFENVKN